MGRGEPHQALDACAPPGTPPLPHGGSGQPKLSTGRLDAVLLGVLDGGQALLHPQSVSGRNLRGRFHRPPVQRPLDEALGMGLVLK